MDAAIVQVAREHANELPGGISPVGLAGTESDHPVAIGHVGADFHQPTDPMHGDGNRQIAQSLAKTHGPFEPTH